MTEKIRPHRLYKKRMENCIFVKEKRKCLSALPMANISH